MVDLTKQGALLADFHPWATDGERKIAKDVANAPHRQYGIDTLAYNIILRGPSPERDELINAMKSFPANPPVLFEEERSNQARIASRVEEMESIAATADLENYEFIPDKENNQILFQFHYPERIEAKRQTEQAYLNATGRVYRLITLGHKLLYDNITEIPTNELHALLQQVVEDSNLDDDPRAIENKWDGIAITCAALAVRAFEWIREEGYLAWYREQLLKASDQPERDWGIGSAVLTFPYGYRRSAASALPFLLQHNPKDKAIRSAIKKLANHDHYEVRSFLFRALRMDWEADEKFVWEIVNEAFKYVIPKKKSPSVSMAARAEKLAHSVLQFQNRNVGVPHLEELEPHHTDLHALACIMYVLPYAETTDLVALTSQQKDFVSQLISLTRRFYEHSQITRHDHKQRLYQVPLEWHSPFFKLLSNWTLHLPLEEARQIIIGPILEEWQNSYDMLENYLRDLLLAGGQEGIEDRFVPIWKYLMPAILKSKTCDNLPKRLDEDFRKLLGLLILEDPSGIVSWKTKYWAPGMELIEEIAFWVERIGHHPDCFPSLVGFLGSIGFPISVSYGIQWITSCFSKVEDLDQILRHERTSKALANLLHEIWYGREEDLNSNKDAYRNFVGLVDKLASRGNQIAVELQRKVQIG